MLSFAGSLKVFVALEACDMRRCYGLQALAAKRLGEEAINSVEGKATA